ncbi:hypothetical protein BDR07DRAFT_1501225 [Suillus spraguei]|nr:hypothetical protein BDR07DRAFT_1501225 [Suillus spraguei]
MTRLKKDSAETKQLSDTIHKKAGRKKRSAVEKMGLADVQRYKEQGVKTHLQASNMRTNYAGHVHRGREWLASHFESSTVSETQGDEIIEHSLVPLVTTAEIHADNDVYEDPAFKDAFENIPNRCSDKALALYMSLKGFHENLSKTTIESICSAFKKMWELSDGDTYHGKWHFYEAKQHWEGNPADSADSYDVLSSIKHKASVEGGDWTHSMAMTKDYMDRAFRWHQAACPLDIALQIIQKVMNGAQPSDICLDLETRTKLSRHLEQITFASNGWTLWTRCFELVKLQQKDISLDTTVLDGVLKMYLANETLTLSKCASNFEIFLANWKGWQKKFLLDDDLDQMARIISLWAHPPAKRLFPAMSANGVVHPGQPISHDTVQKWINESTTSAGIHGNFSTHCFHQGGAQYWFMFAPVGQQWMLAKVCWWGGWADGEHLLFFLVIDALAPISHDADASLASEHALTRPASTEELHMVHASVTADVNSLHNDMCSLTSVVVQAACTTAIALQHLDSGHRFTNVSESASPTTTPPLVGTVQRPLSHRPLVTRMPTAALSTSSTSRQPQVPATASISQQKLPTPGLVIPRIPVAHSDGTSSPKNKSWKEIIEHWLVGNRDRGLTTPLKDWPREWYQGANRRFASKYHQRATIALEFINQYESNEACFLAAYPEAELGHTQLLKAVNKARAA